MPTLTQGEIQAESVIPIASIHDFRMELQGNSHAYVGPDVRRSFMERIKQSGRPFIRWKKRIGLL